MNVKSEQLHASCNTISWSMNPTSNSIATLQVNGKLRQTSPGDYCIKKLPAPRGSSFNDISPNPDHNCYPVACKGEVIHLEPKFVEYKLYLVHEGESYVNYKHSFGIIRD